MNTLRLGFVAALLGAGACATGSVTPGGTTTQAATQPSQQWGVSTREHVDLWLHGFAMLSEDTTLVPYFRRGYKSEMTGVRTRANAVTLLDANRDKLRSRLDVNRSLVNAQFLAMQFGSLDELSSAADLFFQAGGDPRAANSVEMANMLAMLAGYFPTSADRDWLRLFLQSLRDEDQKFYHAYWAQQQTERTAVVGTVLDRWQNMYRPKMQRLMNNTGMPSGTILLSLPLDGEGRSLPNGKLQNVIAVTFPSSVAAADEAIYVIAHEVASSVASTAVTENTTPAERIAGTVDRYLGIATVRAGAMFLQRVAPDLADGYMRYYLRSAGKTVAGSVSTQFQSVFTIPDLIRDAISRQLDVVLGGV
jgi:hypothetical protein